MKPLHVIEADLDAGVESLVEQFLADLDEYLGRVAWMDSLYPPTKENDDSA